MTAATIKLMTSMAVAVVLVLLSCLREWLWNSPDVFFFAVAMRALWYPPSGVAGGQPSTLHPKAQDRRTAKLEGPKIITITFWGFPIEV